MSRPTTRRAVVATALAAPLTAATKDTLAREGTPAAADDVEAIVRSFYEPFNTGDTSVYETLLAEDWAAFPAEPGQQPGPAWFAATIDQLRSIFPDLQLVTEDMLVSGGKVAVRSTIRGTHQGDLFGIPATGQPIEFMTIDIHRIANGQIVETWHVEDYLSVLFQLGVTFQTAMAEATPSA